MGKRTYLRNLGSGYVALAVQILHGFAIVPLALSYLDKESFGVWAIAAQAALWLQLIDAGMTSAVARYLIDYRHHSDTSLAHACVASGFRIFLGQGLLVAGLSIFMGYALAGPLKIPEVHAAEFSRAMTLLGIGTAFGFLTKIVNAWFYAHQRLDFPNWISMMTALMELGLAFLFFSQGDGILAIAHARIIAFGVAAVVYAWFGIRSFGFPAKALVGRFDPGMMLTVGRYALTCFVLTFGIQLLVASQSALVSRYLGVVAVALWATGPKLFGVAQQILAKLWDYALPGLTDQMARGNLEAVRSGFLRIFRVSAIGSGVILGCSAAVNPLFLRWWTSGAVAWPHLNDLLMVLLVFSFIVAKCFTDFVIHMKATGWMPLLLVLEGLAFVVASASLLPRFGLPALIAAAAMAGVMFRLPYGFRKVVGFLSFRREDRLALAESLGLGLLTMAGGYAAVAGGIAVARDLPDLPRLMVAGAAGSIIVVAVFWKLCMDQPLREQVLGKFGFGSR